MRKPLIITASFVFLLGAALWMGRWAADSPAPPPPAPASTSGHAAIATSPVPRPPEHPPAVHVRTEPRQSLLQRILLDGVPVLTVQQLQIYLQQHHRDARSLATASRLTQDLQLLREAAQRFPDDPQVQLELALRSDNPAEKRNAIAALSKADATNAMGPYLSAVEAFTAGDIDESLRQLMTAAERPSLNDYIPVSLQSAEEAFIAAGYPPLEARAAAIAGRATDHENQLVELSNHLSTLAESYTANANTDSVQTVTEMGATLGRQIQSLSGQSASGELVGIGIETEFLKQQDPASRLPGEGITVQERLDQLAARKSVVKRSSHGIDFSDPALTPPLLSQYLNLIKSQGDLAAKQWLRHALGTPVAAP